MPTQNDYTVNRFSNATIVVQLSPPQPIGGWSILWEVCKYFGGGGLLGSSGLITKSAASGFGAGQSGITITNSGQGIFQIQLNSVDTSGMDFGAYAQSVSLTLSGSRTPLNVGYFRLLPSIDG